MERKTAKMSNAKKRSVWTDRDAKVLLELWAERANDLRRARRNGHIYQEISVLMDNKFGPDEVHVKIRNFTQKYREEKKVMGPSGGSPSTWKFFDAVHQIIGSTATNNSEVVESFIYENTSDVCFELLSQPQAMVSSASEPLSSPIVVSPSPLLSSPLTSTIGDASSAKKRNHLGDVVKMMKEQNEMLKTVVEDTQSLGTEIVSAVREQNQNAKEFLSLMKTLVDKI